MLALSSLILAVSGCGRYDEKPACADVIDKKDLGNFTLGMNGEAVDWMTDIKWYRCPSGTYFRHGACGGEPIKLNWDDAMSYADELSEVSGLSWRLPTLSEVQGILNESCGGPAVNPNVFPSLSSANMWTSDLNTSSGFKCAIYTHNGSHSCRNLKRTKLSFFLVAALKS